MNTKKILLSIFLFGIISNFLFAQEQNSDRFNVIEQKLNDLAQTSPGLLEKVDLSVNDVSIQEFIRGLAISNNLNISVDPSLNTKVVSNFSGVPVIDVLLFLCRKYDLDLNFLGSIITITQYKVPIIPIVSVQKKIDINYDANSDKISFELNNDTLSSVTKEITKISGKNIIYVPELGNKLLSGFVQDLSFDVAMQKLGYANNLSIVQTDDKVYQIDKKETVEQAKALKEKEKNQKGKSIDSLNVAGLNFKFLPGDSSVFRIRAIAVPISEVISYLS